LVRVNSLQGSKIYTVLTANSLVEFRSMHVMVAVRERKLYATMPPVISVEIPCEGQGQTTAGLHSRTAARVHHADV